MSEPDALAWIRRPRNFKTPVDVFAVRRDDRRLTIGVHERGVPLQMKEVIWVERPKDALIEPIDHLLDRQIVDPSVEDPALLPGRKTRSLDSAGPCSRPPQHSRKEAAITVGSDGLSGRTRRRALRRRLDHVDRRVGGSRIGEAVHGLLGLSRYPVAEGFELRRIFLPANVELDRLREIRRVASVPPFAISVRSGARVPEIGAQLLPVGVKLSFVPPNTDLESSSSDAMRRTS